MSPWNGAALESMAFLKPYVTTTHSVVYVSVSSLIIILKFAELNSLKNERIIFNCKNYIIRLSKLSRQVQLLWEPLKTHLEMLKGEMTVPWQISQPICQCVCTSSQKHFMTMSWRRSSQHDRFQNVHHYNIQRRLRLSWWFSHHRFILWL